MEECNAVYVPTAIYALPSGPGDALEMARYARTWGGSRPG
jgi:hypothetical protein